MTMMIMISLCDVEDDYAGSVIIFFADTDIYENDFDDDDNDNDDDDLHFLKYTFFPITFH